MKRQWSAEELVEQFTLLPDETDRNLSITAGRVAGGERLQGEKRRGCVKGQECGLTEVWKCPPPCQRSQSQNGRH